MSRHGGHGGRYETLEYDEVRQRNNGPRRERAYDELDIEMSRGNPRRSAPDFFRDDHHPRSSAGQLVVHDRHEEIRGGPPSRRREFEDDTLSIRSGRPEPRLREREIERDDISIRSRERPRPREVEREETDISIRSRERPRPREVEREETDITIRHREEESRPRVREFEREDIQFRRGEGGRPRPREVDIEREEIRYRDKSRPREVEKDEFIYRRDESHHHGREHDVERDTVIMRGRERSLPPPRSRGELVAREREEFIVRRREPSPPPREEIKDEIIIRRTEQRTPSPPSPPPPPPPPPPPEPIVKPPIIQEVITHRRTIDHGVERARSPTPPPPPPSPPRDDSLEISIRRREGPGGAFDEDIIFERETRERKSRDLEIEHVRGRSLSAPRRRATAPADPEFDIESDYYNRKALERAYPGEAWNGATKDWAIVDVPPGTNRVKMDGIGGGSQEITWQRYNGVRRSKFLSGEEEASTDFGIPHRHKTKDMWTEITKDLVLKEAIDRFGYNYEETDFFFYVMEYLRYEDVLQLVELSDEIRRKRRSRIRQIEYEREEIRDRRPAWDERERFYEHDSYRRYR